VQLKLWFFPFSEYHLEDYDVYVYSPDDATWDNLDAGKGILCYHHNGVSPPVIQIACTSEVQTQYVKIFMEHNSLIYENTLTLCEVKVYTSTDSRESLYQHQNYPKWRHLENRRKHRSPLNDTLKTGKIIISIAPFNTWYKCSTY
jgi:hypothetical protein